MKTNKYIVPIKISVDVRATSYDDAQIIALDLFEDLLEKIDDNGNISVVEIDEDDIRKIL